ncbi:basic leucine zipper 23-like [Chenopodium quinoa]|uniref:basic leucine zipper 23-like n=1 Tax=Chenopodium quinoa TaxID=63459 RepID=UPI000B76E6F0|nr:basic leucine zipper 23-like [Chenopodium quinoa]
MDCNNNYYDNHISFNYNNESCNRDLVTLLDGTNLPNTNVGEDHNIKLDNILQDLFKEVDTSTCNLSGKSSTDNDDSTPINIHKSKKRKRRGREDNKEAVRRYREKVKAKEALLEEEIQMLQESNQELLKRLEGEGALQAEITWLKCLLVDIRGRIEGETSSFRYGGQPYTSCYDYDQRLTYDGSYGIGGSNEKSN